MTDSLHARAIAAFCLDPLALGGLWLRGRAGSGRDLMLQALRSALPLPDRRLPAAATDEALYGGVDLALTLAAGRAVLRPGLLADPAVLILPMAERADPALAGRLALAMDGGRHAIIALDEAVEEGEGLPGTLADRMGLCLDPGPLRPSDMPDLRPDAAQLTRALTLLPQVDLPPALVADLVAVADQLGCASVRGILAAMATARALAALDGRTEVSTQDLTDAAILALAHRATCLPPEAAPPEQAPPPAPSPSADDPQPPADLDQMQALQDLMIDAVRAALPPDLLERLAKAAASRQPMAGAGSGLARAGQRKGRPLPARPGRPQSASQLDLVATLRAAAPWQAHRRTADTTTALSVLPSDLRLRRRVEHTDRVLIFAVDASGSAAMARLAEAKGAVELFLAAAYAKRDHVALLAFRHDKAELILPPTRSLAQTKSRLRGLPGGGGTPLAAALQLAMDTATRARKRGMTPTLALLTDGRANVALDGTPGRAAAELDAQRMARMVGHSGLATLVLDVSNRPQPALAELALTMRARYLPLPRAQASVLAATLGSALAE